MLLDISSLCFSYISAEPVLCDLDLKLDRGELGLLLGESGGGKTTLLSLIYGLYDWQEGEIKLNGRLLLGPKGNIVPGEPKIKLVTQEPDLMPYATVRDNVGKYLSNINLPEKEAKIQELLASVGMEDFARVKVFQLSGGQKQRVSLARAISQMPDLLLLDEPFSQLDAFRRVQLRGQFFQTLRQRGIGTLISTHNALEVLPWADCIFVMKDGRIHQQGSPKEVYLYPKDAYVAGLFGEFLCLSPQQKEALQTDRDFIYPSDLRVSSFGLRVEVSECLFAGAHYRCTSTDQFVFYSFNPLSAGDAVYLTL